MKNKYYINKFEKQVNERKIIASKIVPAIRFRDTEVHL